MKRIENTDLESDFRALLISHPSYGPRKTKLELTIY
ncbi:hypothetical protein SAMN05421766_101942 [Zobellia uliginosa]|uniref:Uncharacterized protein n=1 Tax=Zobellia uliginosa TaxID=143224 RepID=A0ABY1KNG1_9FLAO|nr:hypothetical protein SAMN05421766_101942 [Zobellia uliginosa]